MPQGSTAQTCSSCARWMRHLEEQPLEMQMLTQRGHVLCVYSLGRYESWLKDTILHHKQNPHSTVARWFAQTLLSKLEREHERVRSLLWLPGHPTEPFHLVDGVALECARLGWLLEDEVRLFRRLRPKQHLKKLSLSERRTIDFTKIYRVHGRKETAVNTVALLDDVVTTGSTLMACQAMLREHGAIVNTAVTLAATPLVKLF